MTEPRAASTLHTPSHSRLAKFNDCRRAYYYRYVRGLRARGSSTRPLAGKALHAALDVLYRCGYDAIDDAQRALIAVYDEHEPSPKALEYMTTEHLMGVVVNYVKRWPEEDEDFKPHRLHVSQIVDNPKVLAWEGEVDDDGYLVLAEQPMVVDIGGMAMTVVLDLLVERADGSLWVCDHKATAGYLGKGVLNKYLTKHQPQLYIHAARAIAGRCDGAILNAIHMGKSALSLKSNAVKFDRYYFDYTEGQLDDSLVWAQLTNAEEAEARERYGDDEVQWLQNSDSYCAGCDYLPLCEVGSTVRERRHAWYDKD